MSEKRVISLDEYYHVYNRGVEKRTIFIDDVDHKRFMALLYLCNSQKNVHVQTLREEKQEVYSVDRGHALVSIGAYCLMPNHFHVLCKEKEEGGISKFMGKLCTAYAMYFNKRYKRVGPLFQGVFKSQHVDNDEYLRYLFAYIHLNPIKRVDEEGWAGGNIQKIEEAEVHLGTFDYSSYKDFLGVDRLESRILSLKDFPEYFDSPKEFKKMHKELISFKPGP